jgi:hypothetical protein
MHRGRHSNSDDNLAMSALAKMLRPSPKDEDKAGIEYMEHALTIPSSAIGGMPIPDFLNMKCEQMNW